MRQQLLSLLTADDQLDAAADILLARPALVPGLLAAAGVPVKETQQSKESEGSQETEDSQETKESESEEQESQTQPDLTREQLAGALEALVLAADTTADPERQVQIDKQKMMVLYFKVSRKYSAGSKHQIVIAPSYNSSKLSVLS